jgi:S1-C subfamily serine protease
MMRFRFRQLVRVGAAAAAVAAAAPSYAQDTALRDRMTAGTVRIIHAIDKGVVTGSGVLLGNGDYVATNWHVVDADGDDRADPGLRVAGLVNGRVQVMPATVVWEAQPHAKDIAILQLSSPFRAGTSPPMRFTAEEGEAAWAIGFPGVSDQVQLQGAQGVNDEAAFADMLRPTITQGSVSRIHLSVPSRGGAKAIQHQVPLNPGNSGGPLFDACGQLIGLNDMVFDAQGTNLSIHASELEPGLKQLNIPYTTASTCRPASGASSGPVWTAMGAVLILALTALTLTLTHPGRQAVSDLKQRLTRRATINDARDLAQGIQRGRGYIDRPPPGRSQARIRCLSGEYQGLSISVDSRGMIIGRDPTVRGLVFKRADTISKRHCELRWEPSRGAITLADLGSSNGTFLDDGTRLVPNVVRTLQPGQRFYLADRSATFEVC